MNKKLSLSIAFTTTAIHKAQYSSQNGGSGLVVTHNLTFTLTFPDFEYPAGWVV